MQTYYSTYIYTTTDFCSYIRYVCIRDNFSIEYVYYITPQVVEYSASDRVAVGNTLLLHCITAIGI